MSSRRLAHPRSFLFGKVTARGPARGKVSEVSSTNAGVRHSKHKQHSWGIHIVRVGPWSAASSLRREMMVIYEAADTARTPWTHAQSQVIRAAAFKICVRVHHQQALNIAPPGGFFFCSS
jgi:hypothetical protein